MIPISIEEKINEFINRNRIKDTNKSQILPLDENATIPKGYTKDMFKDLSEVGFTITPFNLKKVEFQELELPSDGMPLKNLVKNLNQITNGKAAFKQETMKKMQNPLLYGNLKWIMILFLIFSMATLILTWI